jgi:hypothetical protein
MSTHPIRHLTVQEFAARLRVTPDYVYRELIGQPDGITPIRIGRGPRARLRIPLAEIERWEQSRRVCYDPVPQQRARP